MLVSVLREHVGSCIGLRVSRDNLFLVSGGEDGTVKIWDCQRFKLTPQGRAQVTYQQVNKKIKDQN